MKILDLRHLVYPCERDGGSIWPVKGAGCFSVSRVLLSPLYPASAQTKPCHNAVSASFLVVMCL